jgi:hypothetical protein
MSRHFASRCSRLIVLATRHRGDQQALCDAAAHGVTNRLDAQQRFDLGGSFGARSPSAEQRRLGFANLRHLEGAATAQRREGQFLPDQKLQLWAQPSREISR